MSDSSKAVFLSYASQDAEAAKRICEALRAAGVEVWFDQNELVGGVVRSWRLIRFDDPGFGNLAAKNAKNAKSAESAERTHGLFFVFSAFFAVNWLD